MEDIIDIIVTETTNLIEITSQPTDEIIDVNIIDNREDVTLNVTPTLVEININSLTGNFGVNWGEITGTLSNQTDLNTALGLKADLVGGKVPSSQLPSYVDDIIEVATYSALPTTGETGKIYVVLDTNLIYRWSGSAYVEIKDSSAVWGAITGTLSSQTDLQSALNAKFNNPSGDTTQYIAGDGSLITFPIAGQAGTLVRQVRNTTGATLTKGTIVYINGASGNKPTVTKAIATADATSAQTFGFVQADISNNSNGYVVCNGDLIGLDTSAVTEGTQLYLSSTTAGAYTTTKQVAPAHLVYVGVITRSHPTQGQIEVKIQNGYELDEIHDVLITSKANNDGLFYESSSGLWKNKTIANVLGYTPEQPLTFSSPLSRSTNTISIPIATSSANGYLSSSDWTTFNAKQAALSGTGFVKISGTTISYDNSTYLTTSAAASTYLALTGGTLTGALSGLGATFTQVSAPNFTSQTTTTNTQGSRQFALYSGGLRESTNNDFNVDLYDRTSNSWRTPLIIANNGGAATFSSSVTASSLYVTGMTAGSGAIYHTGSRLTFANYNASGTLHFEVNGGTGALTLNSDTSASFVSTISATGATLTGALSGTSATLSGDLTLTSSGGHTLNMAATTSGSQTILMTAAGGGSNTITGTGGDLNIQTTSASPIVFKTNSTEVLRLASGGAATFTFDNNSNGVTYSRNVSGTIYELGSVKNSGSDILYQGTGAVFINADSNSDSTSTDREVRLGNRGVAYLTIGSAGAATFSSSVTAGGRILTTASGNDTFGFQMYKSGTSTTLAGFYQNSTGDGLIAAYNSSGTQTVNLGTNGTSYLTGGNVGIGTTSPSSKLQIEGTGTGAWLTINRTDSGTNIVDFTQSGTRLGYVGYIGTEMWFNNATASATVFSTSGTERMRITSGGDVYAGSTNVPGNLVASDNTTGYFYSAGFGINTSTGVSIMGIAKNDYALQLNRQGNADGGIILFRRNGTAVGSISVTTLGTSYNVMSDYRLKEDLKPINGLEIVNKIKIYDYKWKANDSRMDGVLAHELAEVLPYAVQGVKDGEEMQQVDYSKIVPVMVQAIKDLKAELDTLKNK